MLRDKTSHPFTPKSKSIRVSKHVEAKSIIVYAEIGDPIRNISKHEAFMLGRIRNGNNFAMLFPSTLFGTVSCSFFDTLCIHWSIEILEIQISS